MVFIICLRYIDASGIFLILRNLCKRSYKTFSLHLVSLQTNSWQYNMTMWYFCIKTDTNSCSVSMMQSQFFGWPGHEASLGKLRGEVLGRIYPPRGGGRARFTVFGRLPTSHWRRQPFVIKKEKKKKEETRLRKRSRVSQ